MCCGRQKETDVLRSRGVEATYPPDTTRYLDRAESTRALGEQAPHTEKLLPEFPLKSRRIGEGGARTPRRLSFPAHLPVHALAAQ